MDTTLEQALAESNRRAIFENQREKLKESLQANLLYAFDGGYFKLGSELFLEIKINVAEGKKSFPLLDIHMNPIDIDNPEEFYKTTRSLYNEAINKYRINLAKLKRSKNTKNLVEVYLEDDDIVE